jgi:CheY-like chemotaxis protein
VLDPHIGRVKADPGQLEQVIMNLAVNARDAMPKGGKLTIETANVALDANYAREHVSVKPGSYVMMAVTDNGIGMDAETCARVFEPFFTTKEQGKGTGLGLSTVYGIVKQSGGYIRATSALGSGSTFEVYLPECTELPKEPQAEAAEATESPGRGETVLLVEDEDAVRMAERKALVRAGFRVLEAANGVHALNVYATSRIDLVVTDLIMPEMGGRELATRLRQRNPEVKVLFTSGYTDDATIRGGETGPASSFLAKPFTPEALSRKARELLDQRAS